MEEIIKRNCLRCGEEFILGFFDLREKNWCDGCEIGLLTFNRDVERRREKMAFLHKKLNGPYHNEVMRELNYLNNNPIPVFELELN